MLQRFTTLLVLISPLTAAGESIYFSDIPDFTQTDVKGAGFGNGQQFCAPAAVSNSLAWLGRDSGSQKSLVTLLASADYMNTDLKIGTGTNELLRGVHKYVNEELGGYRTLTYQGWRRHPTDYSTGIEIPELSFISRGVSERSAAWVNVGWYKVNAATKSYERVGGHWVTLVGYDLAAKQLVFHDPAPRAGYTKQSEHVSFRTLTGGRLTGKKNGLPTSAVGRLQLGQGMHLNGRADAAIIDGVVLLEL